MATTFKHRRGTTTQHSTFTGAAGEITVDTTKNTAVVHDGSTAGGFPLVKESSLGTLATQNANSVTITGGSISGITDLAVADGGTGASTAADARTNLGLGSIATQSASSVSITGGSISGITDLAVADGGTGASTAADARTNLGVTATGSDTTYAYRANNLSDLVSASTARTNLGLGTIATQAANNVSITGGSISGITDLAIADGGTGASTAADARTNLGLGTIATQAASSVSITGGSISGITDLAVADGGTGASTAADARTNLGLGTIATQAANNVSITGGSITGVSTITEKTSATGSSLIPAGTTAQRDASPAAGYFRYNSSLAKFEGYNGSAWGSVGGGATGAGGDDVFVENGQTVTTNYTLSTNKNAMSAGPITVNSGITVTVPSGSRWVVV